MSFSPVHFWKNWSIRQQLLLITLLPVSYLFCMLVWHSYWSHGREVDAEIDERGKIISQLLAKSSEYELVPNRLPELKFSLQNLIQSEPSIVSIDILGTDRKPLLHSQSPGKDRRNLRGFETPIVKRLIWVNVIPESEPTSNDAMRSGNSTEIIGYVVVVMSPDYLQGKQSHRFMLELVVAALGLLMSAALAVQLSRSLSASFRTFVDACRAIRAGSYPVQIEVNTGGEIGELQASINSMASSLEQSTLELENKVAQRTRELENSRNDALKANDEKRKLIHQVQHIVEEERKNIAIEVHDQLNAALISMRLQAQRIADLADADTHQETKQLALSIKQAARTLYDSGRAMVRRLRPEVLDMLGLQGAIEEMVDGYNKLHPSCAFTCEVVGNFSALNNAAAMSLYRIIQEALSNSIKHAHAQHLRIKLALDNGEVVLEIADDGVGFNQDESTSGIGLVGMRERVFALGGTMTIESATGQGEGANSGAVIGIRFRPAA
jgi:two-component system sensor histidine kinase UhpB